VKNYRAYLFDLDGTIYLGDEILPGVADAIAWLKSGGAAVRYVTNNPTRTETDYANKLSGLGIETAREEVVTSVTATIQWLQKNAPAAKV